ncbi:MAG TPA: class I SAM-dependent methyltransferase [Anaerolineae bacterium]|jgi:ubiquinone/menaquinone biosynthesis C-methylase UbiE
MTDWIILGLLALMLLAIVLYWQLAIAEGAYLGKVVVTLLYDWFAPRYDKVKNYRPALDSVMLAAPIIKHLAMTDHGDASTYQVLDVATGTGRLPQAVLAQKSFRGHITALDLSRRMIAVGQVKLRADADRITWLIHDAQQLPFDNESFDVVTSLEALEFFPNQNKALHEMIRVLRKGGLLMVTNRIGPDAWKLPGRTQSSDSFARWLALNGLHDIECDTWLIDYDLIRAIK